VTDAGALPEPTDAQKELARARAIFDAGDYLLLREVATPLTKSDDPEVRRAAEDLLRNVEIDPVAKWIGLATLALLLFVTYWWVIR